MYEWDEAQRRTNLAKHGVDFAEIVRFHWGSATIKVDPRRDYGEERLSATGLIHGRLYVCVFTLRRERIRVISLRKANRRDITKWHSEKR